MVFLYQHGGWQDLASGRGYLSRYVVLCDLLVRSPSTVASSRHCCGQRHQIGEGIDNIGSNDPLRLAETSTEQHWRNYF